MSMNVTPADILEYCRANPDLEIQDLFKFLYQACLGCGHLAADPGTVARRLCEELPTARRDDLPAVEPLGAVYCRVHLKTLTSDRALEALCRAFIRSAQPCLNGREKLEAALALTCELAAEGQISLPLRELQAAICRWRTEDFPPVRHSETYRSRHCPAYRVIEKAYLPAVLSPEGEGAARK